MEAYYKSNIRRLAKIKSKNCRIYFMKPTESLILLLARENSVKQYARHSAKYPVKQCGI
jgi:hypothetical protein